MQRLPASNAPEPNTGMWCIWLCIITIKHNGNNLSPQKEQHGQIGNITIKHHQTRRLCSGKTLAFQAKDAGSIPARRSNFLDQRPRANV